MFLSEVEVRSVPTAPQCDQWEKGGGRGLVGWLIGGGAEREGRGHREDGGTPARTPLFLILTLTPCTHPRTGDPHTRCTPWPAREAHPGPAQGPRSPRPDQPPTCNHHHGVGGRHR